MKTQTDRKSPFFPKNDSLTLTPILACSFLVKFYSKAVFIFSIISLSYEVVHAPIMEEASLENM